MIKITSHSNRSYSYYSPEKKCEVNIPSELGKMILEEQKKEKELKYACALLLISIKNEEIKLFPEKESTTDYVQMIENAIAESFYATGDKLKITAKIHGHGFEIGEKVECLSTNGRDCLVQNEKGEKWFVLFDEIAPCEPIYTNLKINDE